MAKDSSSPLRLPPLKVNVYRRYGGLHHVFNVDDPRADIVRFFNQLNSDTGMTAAVPECRGCGGAALYRGVCESCLDTLLGTLDSGYATVEALVRVGMLDPRLCKVCRKPSEMSLCQQCIDTTIVELKAAEKKPRRKGGAK